MSQLSLLKNLSVLTFRDRRTKSVRWAGAFATCSGHWATQSSTIVYEIEPGGHLGWHTDATEETQYIIAGTGELRMEDGKHMVGPGSVFALPANVRRQCQHRHVARGRFFRRGDVHPDLR
jgi:quercetin dioxygenase-like cupin family protein